LHPCLIEKAHLELEKIAIRSGQREYESGWWIGGEGDMRRAGFNVAKRHVIGIRKVLAASVEIYDASASLIIQVLKAVFGHTE